MMKSFVAPLMAMFLGMTAAVAAVPEKTTAHRITEQRRLLPLDASHGYSGASWDALVADAAGAQFTMVGEQHGIADVAALETQLEGQLIARGYTNAAFEVGPYSVQFAEELLRKNGSAGLERYLAQPDHGFTIPFFFFRDEMPLPAQMVAASPDRGHAIWGMDQEFVGSGPIFIELLSRRARNSRQRAAVAAFAKRLNKPDSVGRLEDADLQPLAAAYRNDRAVQDYVAALRKTISIYRPFMHGGPGYPANLERETYMKANFLAQFRAAQQRRRVAPKVFLKFGAFHAMRGFSGTNVPAFTNFIAEWGQSEGYGLVNVMVDCSTGKMMTPGGPVPCEPLLGPDTALGSAADRTTASIIDLRPLRPQLGAMKDLDAGSRQAILAYDYYVSIPNVRPSTFVNTPKL